MAPKADVVLQRPTRFGLGCQLTMPERPLGPHPRVFGHFGAGGSLGFADPDTRLAARDLLHSPRSDATERLQRVPHIGRRHDARLTSPGRPPASMSRRPAADVLVACLFVSGATALVYEVVWLRMLGLVFGHSVYAITAILTAFMGGLGLGSYVFGRRAAGFSDPIR